MTEPLDTGDVVAAWLRLAAAEVAERRTWLSELDAAIGDGDHGINLDRGLRAVVEDLDAGRLPPDGGAMLAAAGRRLLGVVGGASGALYGRGLMTAGRRVQAAPLERDDGRRLAEAALAGTVEGIAALGHAAPGDKTMLDALVPALDALRGAAGGASLTDVAGAAAQAAAAGAASTGPLVARKGRASYLGDRSIGHLDPGAASSEILVRCLARALVDRPAAR